MHAHTNSGTPDGKNSFRKSVIKSKENFVMKSQNIAPESMIKILSQNRPNIVPQRNKELNSYMAKSLKAQEEQDRLLIALQKKEFGEEETIH